MSEEQEISSDERPVISEIEKKLEEIEPNISDDRRKEIAQALLVSYEKTHSGPLPSAEELKKYDKIIPNGADRIMKMAELQQGHRIEMEKTVITSQMKQSGKGQNFGLFIGLAGLLVTFGLAYIGSETVASIVGGATIISLTSVFVIDKFYQKKDLNDKEE